MTALGLVAGIVALAWVVIDPTGAANTVIYVGHQVGVLATSLAQHLSAGKPALPGESGEVDQGQG